MTQDESKERINEIAAISNSKLQVQLPVPAVKTEKPVKKEEPASEIVVPKIETVKPIIPPVIEQWPAIVERKTPPVEPVEPRLIPIPVFKESRIPLDHLFRKTVSKPSIFFLPAK